MPSKTEYSSILKSEHIIHNHLTTMMKIHLFLIRRLKKEREILLKVPHTGALPQERGGGRITDVTPSQPGAP
jgi:hypothetical protein